MNFNNSEEVFLQKVSISQKIKNQYKKIIKILRKYRGLWLRIFDFIVIVIAYILGQILAEKTIPYQAITNPMVWHSIIVSTILYITAFTILKLYRNITRYENGNDYILYGVGCFLAYSVMAVLSTLVEHHIVGIRVNMVAALVIVVGVISYRVIFRFILIGNSSTSLSTKGSVKKNIIIIGAGNAASVTLKILHTTLRESYNVIGIIDDNLNKVNHVINGVKILGTRYDIPKVCRENRVDMIFFCISNISNKEKRDILTICQETGCKTRVLPATEEIIESKNFMGNFRDVEIEDLLGREAIKLDNKDIEKEVEGKVVMVTGGGGSIGSELCRQIIKYNPRMLVMVDIYENNLYEIEQELKSIYPESKNFVAIVASVRDKKRLNEIFEKYNPYLVFHAAAHKHVPLMETSPLEAIKNNVFGTYNVVNCADKYNAHKFVLISTDKAVNPTNIMGATKRMCELIVQAKSKVSKTRYAAVRFGNVLGSNGSVIPLFKKQIAKGGPVTVTHKEITRFFMTIPEAVSLVLQSMTYAKDGEIFVLDMGEPVKIYDMACKLINLSGYEPNVDIDIKITGLRPGEKIYEELLMAEEGLENTKHDKIFIAPPSNITMENIKDKLETLNKLLEETDNDNITKIKETIKKVVPTFKDNTVVNKEKLNKEETVKNKEQITLFEEKINKEIKKNINFRNIKEKTRRNKIDKIEKLA